MSPLALQERSRYTDHPSPIPSMVLKHHFKDLVEKWLIVDVGQGMFMMGLVGASCQVVPVLKFSRVVSKELSSDLKRPCTG